MLPKESNFFYDHPYLKVEDVDISPNYSIDADQSITTSACKIESWMYDKSQRLESISNRIDELLYEELSIPDSDQQEIRTEIKLRTGKEPGTTRSGSNDVDIDVDEDTVREYAKIYSSTVSYPKLRKVLTELYQFMEPITNQILSRGLPCDSKNTLENIRQPDSAKLIPS
jgi:hypothetical protein